MSTVSAVLSVVFGLCSGAAALCFPFVLVSARRDYVRGAVTAGTVVRMEDVPAEGWIAHIRYEVDGVSHTLSVGSRGGYTVGETVEVRYVQDEPERAYLASGGHIWLRAFTALVLAVAFAGAAALFYFLGCAGVL